MVSKHRQARARIQRVGAFQRFPDLAIKLQAKGGREIFVKNLCHEPMRKREATRGTRNFAQETRRPSLLNSFQEILRAEPAERTQGADIEFATNRRCDFEKGTSVFRQGFEPTAHDVAQSFGNAQADGLSRRAAVPEPSFGNQQGGDFIHE